MKKRSRFLTLFYMVLSCVLCSIAVNWVALPNGFVVTGLTGLSMTAASFVGINYALIFYGLTLLMLLCTAGFGILLLTGVLDLNTIPQLVDHRPGLAVAVILALFAVKGISGVVVYNALVVVVSLIFPLPAALAINAVGTALCLSISYWIGRSTRTESLEGLLNKHPKLRKYFAATQEYGFVSCFAIHMLGLNMEVLGVLFGMMRLNYWSYLASSCLAIMPGMVCFCILGNNLDFRNPVFWALLIADGLLILGALWYTRHKLGQSSKRT